MGMGDGHSAGLGRGRDTHGQLQKVFSGDPTIGFFAQRDRYKDALDAGEVLPPATNMDDMQAVVTNSTVDGVLAALLRR